ncbi:hypothetical protein TIFTF001_052611, partial [Ficus carica]
MASSTTNAASSILRRVHQGTHAAFLSLSPHSAHTDARQTGAHENGNISSAHHHPQILASAKKA